MQRRNERIRLPVVWFVEAGRRWISWWLDLETRIDIWTSCRATGRMVGHFLGCGGYGRHPCQLRLPTTTHLTSTFFF